MDRESLVHHKIASSDSSDKCFLHDCEIKMVSVHDLREQLLGRTGAIFELVQNRLSCVVQITLVLVELNGSRTVGRGRRHSPRLTRPRGRCRAFVR